ncbi:M48 family metallopeptidase [Plebeiibacterium sediminum]|uniref:M48 family metallopeptidase n=1 Tax=Plebeiibacterium sediminum TaxID=2992112 RepID=A0AAE3M9T7_9BACT|nr:M48 family metallopeptidase [Plebeiobacterium sediminum]MCW3789666.1 M48 family metallopeptidase [Plebeiobacterium sediminum]
MKNTFVRGIILVVLFFSSWYIIKQIDWIALFKVQKVTDKTEEKLGELFWRIYNESEEENTDDYIINAIDSIITKICLKNSIDRYKIKLHILDKNEVNAFALPNGHLIIYSGLIIASDNQEELSGVLCHEIAHIENNHVMKKLIKEVGLSVLISMATGDTGSNIIKETARMISSTAFDRKLEKEADIKAVEYLINANLNPEPFGNFLYKISEKEEDSNDNLEWFKTHPNTKERAKYITEHSKNKYFNHELAISEKTWYDLQVRFQYK